MKNLKPLYYAKKHKNIEEQNDFVYVTPFLSLNSIRAWSEVLRYQNFKLKLMTTIY